MVLFLDIYNDDDLYYFYDLSFWTVTRISQQFLRPALFFFALRSINCTFLHDEYGSPVTLSYSASSSRISGAMDLMSSHLSR